MKRVILLAAIAAIAATTPALARKHHKVSHHQARHYVVPGAAYGYMARGYPARQPVTQCVYVAGRYAGCDPDPNIRQRLVDDYYYLHGPYPFY
jgi:hypothetical protein